LFPFKQIPVWRIKSRHDRFLVLGFQLSANTTYLGRYIKPIILAFDALLNKT
jgi:hypothetical protein